MAIVHLTVENFKSFCSIDVNFAYFNAVVGSNATGKSNFVQVFEFLRNIKTLGLEDTIALHGGVSAVRNFNLDQDALLRFKVETDDMPRFAVEGKKSTIYGLDMGRPSNEFVIRFNKRGGGYRIVHDEIIQPFAVYELESDETEGKTYHMVHNFLVWQASRGQQYRQTSHVGNGLLSYKKRGRDSLVFSVQLPKELPLKVDELFPFAALQRLPHSSKSLLLESSFPKIITGWQFAALEHSVTFDIDAKKAKTAVPMTGAKELERDGGNLAVVLREILQRPETRKKFLNLLSDLLPFLNDVSIERSAASGLLTVLTERYTDRLHDLYATWASDGTMSILALLVAMYFDERELAIFEESDRNIHPHLIRKVVQMMKEASEDKQIILTTHSPEMLRHVDLKDILLISRDSEGCSQISRPADSEAVRAFIDSELGVSDLFVDNLLAL